MWTLCLCYKLQIRSVIFHNSCDKHSSLLIESVSYTDKSFASFKNIYLCNFHFWIGNCDIDFYNFRHRKVRNFEISNQFERQQNFTVIFRRYWKQKRNSKKTFAISRNSIVIPLKFHEILLVSWNLINYCKITPYLVKFCKSPKDLGKILWK